MSTLEICVDTPDDLAAAIEAQVDRIELCSALDLGGLTPTPGMIELAKGSDVPIYAMIRPRAGDFIYTPSEVRSMEADIAAMQSAGFEGVVFGVLNRDKTLDIATLSRLCSAAGDMGKTLHRAVDEMPLPRTAVQTAIDLGFERILTSGGANTAVEGLDEIVEMNSVANGRIEIMAGSGVSYRVVDQLDRAGIHSFHASCREPTGEDGAKRLNDSSLEKTLSAVRRCGYRHA